LCQLGQHVDRGDVLQVERLGGPCKITSEVISGSVSLTDETTVCCPSGGGA
jgi:hypothetical protein